MRKHRSLVLVLMMIVLCATIIVGSTMAYYTDEVPASENLVTSGDLEVKFEWADKLGEEWQDAASAGPIFNQTHWEPNFTTVKYIQVSNTGDMPFQYELNVVPTLVPEEGVNLMDVIDVYFGVVDENTPAITAANYADELQKVGNLTALLKNENGAGYGIVLPKDAKGTLPQGAVAYNESVTVCIALHMQHTAGNEYMNRSVGEGFNVQLAATQYTYDDAFGTLFSGGAQLPEVEYATSKTVSVTPDENGLVPYDIVFESDTGVIAVVPQGARMEQGANQLILIVYPKAKSDANLTLSENEQVKAWEVKVEGLADDNTVPVRFTLPEAMQKGLNIGNYSLYHVENGTSVPMTRVEEITASSAHNSFSYNPAPGDMGLALATFSEVAIVSNEENAWNGLFDYTWYTNAVALLADGEADYIIANADQLAAFGAIVGGMDGQTRDSFSGKTVKLISDINLGDNESENKSNIIFYPIGYYNSTGSYEKKSGVSVTSSVSSFEGTFDGNGHTISNFYQNTWEMFGDYNNGYSGTPNHYKDAMGLFGYVMNGTIKNLTVDHFSSDGEFTPTGVIAAYAVNSTFENIAITNCNPRVYNTGNGGIVGIGGNSDDPDTYKLTFTNITIDNTNKISALWGSWDVACGGLVGMFRGAGHVYMTNCHVAAQMDVNNDVCGNYQYYWYRYSGMMVGTNKNMTTDANGYTVPETDKFHAENCTVHFGDWNDYYYCELVANSLASYTHDHQFSRLEQVTKVEGTTITPLEGDAYAVPSSGRYNYVVVNGEAATENATCYHFVDGKVWNHADAGEETVNGKTVLKEDKQHIYLPFDQVYTGYGWGVKHVPSSDFTEDAIKILDRDANSVKKFTTVLFEESIINGNMITVGKLFAVNESELENNKIDIKVNNVQIFVSPVGEESTVVGTYVANNTDWTQGTLTFSGTGAATITITDYYFCTPTTINVNIKDKEAAEKFETKFTGDFLYRVGNQNAVKLDSLFKAKDSAKIGNVSVTIEALNGTAASGTYTPNATWTDGTIQFSGTGVVKVTITDNDYCIPADLYLEVVDATNLTSATGTTTGGNFVLLCDVNTSTYVNYWNCTLYGNGFTYSLNGAPTAYNSKQGHGVLITKNATLDNLVIVGDVYNSYGAYTTQDYYNTAVDVVDGEVIIQNCYIANCAAPIKIRGGNLVINDTTLYGGTVANLIINAGTVTLDDVTTANYNDGRSLVGMGIVVHKDAEGAKLILEGSLKQYNYICEKDAPNDSNAKVLFDAMFTSSCNKYHFGTSPNRYVNTGIVSMSPKFKAANIIDNANTGYEGTPVNVQGNDGFVYTQPNTSGSVNNGYDKENDPHVATTQGAVPPSYSFDYTNKNYVAKTDGSNDYCYEENGKVNISMDEGDTFNWDTSILTIGKGITNYTVSMNDTDYTGKSIAFNTDGDYEVVYTYTDDNNFGLDENGNITTYSVTYTKTVNISVAVIEAATKHAEFTMGSSNAATEKITVDNATYISATGVTADNSTWTHMTIGDQKIYYPIIAAKLTSTKGSSSYAYFPVFESAVTITDYADGGTGDAVTYNSSTLTLPSTLTAVKGVYKEASNWPNLTNSDLTQSDASNIFKWASSSAAPSDPTTYKEVLCYKSPEISANRNAYITLVQYSYTDAANTTYYYYVGYTIEAFTKECVTPDTLVTLADGTQVRVDSLTGNEKLLVWNMEEGRLDEAGILFVDHDPEAEFEIVHLYFSDGTDVKVIYEHGFWDYDLNRYVYLDKDAAKYIGHSFFKLNGNGGEKVQLTDVVIEKEVTTAWSPVTENHLCYFVNGMLSMPGGVGGLFNIFDVDAETMMYDMEALAKDIETYGLFTYEELNGIVELPEEMFNAAGGAYLKISIGKGNLTMDELIYMINRYKPFF